MFDAGIFEFGLILVVALLVVGPERLPRLARTAGLWLGKVRGMVGQVKADIDRELAAEELKRSLQKQAEETGLHEIIEETRDFAKDAVAHTEAVLQRDPEPDNRIAPEPEAAKRIAPEPEPAADAETQPDNKAHDRSAST